MQTETPKKILPKAPYIFAHRGASGNYPENTLLAFSKALELGADGIETDAYRSKDGHVVLSHDRKVKITQTNGVTKEKPIMKCTLKELKQITLKEDQKIPKLSEVLEWAEKEYHWTGPRGLPLKISIDLQHLGVIKPLLNVASKHSAIPYMDLCASWGFMFRKVRQFNSNVPLIASNTAKTTFHFNQYRRLKIQAFNVKLADIKVKDVYNIKKQNFHLYIWDLHDEDRLKESIQYKPDAIYSNYPALAKSVLHT